jgi:hypothetical protein
MATVEKGERAAREHIYSQELTFLAKQNPNMGKLGSLVGATLLNLEIESKRE